MLKITRLSKSYPQRGLVLDNLDLELNDGDTLAITGPSGSGKTTLLNLIGLLDTPDAGDIVFDEVSILTFNSDQASGYRNRKIGFVFQDHLLMPHLTIFENIMLPLLAGKLSASSLKNGELYCMDLMNEVGIGELKDKYPFQVSGGEAQRASLVRALVNRPSVILADEPTGSLDTANASLLADLLIKMNRDHGISIIAATHSQTLADKMARHLILSNGLLV
jgi:lipoprotein-releasing system ATP-binding protein